MRFIGQLFRFGCVGVIAMVLHLAVVIALVPCGVPPLWANVLAFGIAFQASYFGHCGWTFRSSGGRGAYGRMLVVSLASFALNEAMYACLLKFASFDYRWSLALVLVVVALFTFVGSRFWVFTRSEQQS
jgi:putative flippase GtrA